jgi:hypothetical protein
MCFRHVWATQSYVTTQHWKTAVAHGHVDATWSLARVYEKGRHSAKRSHSKAVTLYMQGAAKGDARCQHHVARAYKNGEGVQQSYTKAIAEYEKSAKQGFAQSHHNLGCIYANGIKTASGKVQVKKDLDKARKHFKKGAELDCTPSWHALHALDAHMAEEKQKAQKEAEARLVAEALLILLELTLYVRIRNNCPSWSPGDSTIPDRQPRKCVYIPMLSLKFV